MVKIVLLFVFTECSIVSILRYFRHGLDFIVIFSQSTCCTIKGKCCKIIISFGDIAGLSFISAIGVSWVTASTKVLQQL